MINAHERSLYKGLKLKWILVDVKARSHQEVGR